MTTAVAGATAFFALDDADWVREPSPVAGRRDVTLAFALFVVSALGLELARSGGGLHTDVPVWQQYVGLAAMAAPIAVRRRWPLGVAAVASLAFFVVGVRMPDVALQLSVQGLYFFALFSAMAWARDRRVALLVMGAILVGMFGWLSFQFLLGSAIDQINADLTQGRSRGVLDPVAATVLYLFLVNVLYFGGAVLGGQAAWNAARRRASLHVQAETLRGQAGELREHVVVEERLRIARELHDVVAHHVSVMGVQAGAARRVLASDPAAASSALAFVESSAREAVVEMRALLGTLRQGERTSPPTPGRAPEPTLDALPALLDQVRAKGLDVLYTEVCEPPGSVTDIPSAVALTLYRTAQEALHNIGRHSTAASATIVLRVSRSGPRGGFAEVEVLDAGRPRTGTSGTGLGLLGMRERVASLDGALEIGPRATGGFRVRVRLPLGSTGGASDADRSKTVRQVEPAR